MARPLIATKLFIPQVRRHVVTRTRLLDRLRRGAESRLTLVSAPAGFGKTTLLAEWLGGTQEDDRRIAWVSLDASDSDQVWGSIGVSENIIEASWEALVDSLEYGMLVSGRRAPDEAASQQVRD